MTFVTGGASGRFARNGSEVIFCYLPTSNGNAVARAIGDNVTYVHLADITKEKEVQNAINHIEKEHGRLDVLVNCADRANAIQTHSFTKTLPWGLPDF